MGARDDMKAITKAISDAVDSVTSKQNFDDHMKFAADMVRVRTRLGYGVERNEGPRSPLKPLSSGYKERRSKSEKLSNKTTPSKSNLTFTGELIDSLEGKATANARGEIEATGTREDGLTNAQLAEYVSDQGRPFLNLSDTEVRRLTDAIRKEVIETVQRKLTRLK